MVAPSLSGITRLRELVGASWVLSAFADATHAFSTTSNTFTNVEGEGNSIKLSVLNIASGGSTSDIFGAYTVLDSALNLETHLFVTHLDTPGSLANGTRICLLSGGLTEYRIYSFASGTFSTNTNVFNVIVLDNSAFASETPGFDPTNVTLFGILAQRRNTSSVNFTFRQYQALAISKTGYAYIGGDFQSPGTLEDWHQRSHPNSSNSTGSLLVRRVRDFFYSIYPPEFRNDLLEISGKTLELIEDSELVRTSGTKRFLIESPDAFLSNSIIRTSTETTATSITIPQGGDGEINSTLFLGDGTFDAIATGTLTVRGSTIENKSNVSLEGGSYRNLSLNNFPVGATLNLEASDVRGLVEPVAAINFNLPPGIYPGLQLGLEPGQKFNVTQVAGEYVLTGITGGTVANPIIIDNTGGEAVVVKVNGDIEAVVANPVTAGTLTIETPQSQIVVTGLPDVADVRLLVKNITAATQEFFTVTGGTINIPTVATSTYELRADAPGYLASDYIELPGNTPQFRFNLINRRDIYDAGVTRFDRVIFNPSTFEVFITDGLALLFADVFRTIEDYLVMEDAGTVPGLLYTSHPIPVTVPGRQILRFVFDTVNNSLNPARIKPHPANLGDPELLFEIELERAEDFGLDPTYALLDYSVAPVGRIIRVRSQVAIANVNVSGGLSTEDRAVIDAIESKVTPIPRLAKRFAGVDGVSTTYSDNAITSSDGDVDITLTDNGDGSYTATPN